MEKRILANIVDIKDLKKIYKMGEVEIKAVSGITFSIEEGEFVIIVGPSVQANP